MPSRLHNFVFALVLTLGAAPARAGVLIEVSAGSGFRLSPSPTERIPTNVMLAGGYDLADIVKVELGVVGNLSDVKDSKFDLDLRPMIVVSPPFVPLYARGIFGVTGLLDGPAHVNYGGALGLSIGALGVGAFVEAGALSRRVDWVSDGGARTTKDIWIGEARLGIYFK